MMYNHFQPPPDQIAYQYQKPSGMQPGSPVRKALMMALLVAVVLVVILVGVGLVNSSKPNGPEAQLSQVVTRQEKVLQLIEDYGENTNNGENLNQIASMKAILTTDLNKLQKQGFSSNPSSREVTDSQVEQQISNALTSTNFDEVFIGALKSEISNNESALQAAYDLSSNQEFKNTLEQIILNEQSLAN